MLLLGVLAAQAEAAPAGVAAYDLLETEILTGSQASVTFSSLSSTYGADYQHLQIRATIRTDRANTGDLGNLFFNGDTTVGGAGIYYGHQIYGTGSSVVSTSYDAPYLAYWPAANETANIFSAAVIDILDPFDTNKNSTARIFSSGADGRFIQLDSILWGSTAAVTSLTFDGIGNLVSGSRFSLYGLKAA